MKNSRAIAYYGYALSAALAVLVVLALAAAAVTGLAAEEVEDLATPLLFFGLLPAALSGAAALAATLAGGRREPPLTRAGALLALAAVLYALAIGPFANAPAAQWVGLASFAAVIAYCAYSIRIFLRWRRLGSVPSLARP